MGFHKRRSTVENIKATYQSSNDINKVISMLSADALIVESGPAEEIVNLLFKDKIEEAEEKIKLL